MRQGTGKPVFRRSESRGSSKLPDLFLRNSGLHQRVYDAVLGRGPETGPPVPQIIGVCSRKYRCVTLPCGERGQSIVEFALQW